MKLSEVVTTLTILMEQMTQKGFAEDEFDELIMLPDRVKLKRGTKAMTIPLVTVSLKQ